MTLTLRIIAIVAAVVLVLGLVTLKSCQDSRTASTRGEIAEGRAGAAEDSGRDAVNTTTNTSAREAQIINEVNDGTESIRAAPGGDSNAAADRAACRLRSYRRSERCVALLGPAPN